MNKNIGDMTRSELIDYVIELQEENSGYERKIDKAIEFIEKNTERAIVNGENQFLIDQEDIPIILNILKGVDKE